MSDNLNMSLFFFAKPHDIKELFLENVCYISGELGLVCEKIVSRGNHWLAFITRQGKSGCSGNFKWVYRKSVQYSSNFFSSAIISFFSFIKI